MKSRAPRRTRWMRAALALALPVSALSAVVGLGAAPASAVTLQQVTSFGTNPSNLRMYWYVPSRVAAKPGLLVLLHSCQGSASYAANGLGPDYLAAADTYGYIVVVPEATRSGACWDVHSAQALKRGGGSDPVGIMSMVDYVRGKYSVDSNKIVVSGFSSGGMMTNVLAGLYPDVFKAGAAFSGVPATCFSTTDGSEWNGNCSGGRIVKTPQEWGDAVRGMYPGYTGSRPRMQLWHGGTDTTLSYVNYGEAIKQWTNVHGVSQTPVKSDSPVSGWARTRYGSTDDHPAVEGMSYANAGHSLPLTNMLRYAITFLGLDNSTPTTSPTTTSPTTTTTTTRTTTTSSPPQSGVLLNSTFEDGTTGGWGARSSEQVAVVSSAAHSGSRSLQVSGRTANWNGPIRDVTSILLPGKSYYLSAWGRLADGESASTLSLTLERTSGGTTAYDHVGGEVSAAAGNWVRLFGQYTVPTDASAVRLYVESASATAGFLVDDVVASTDPIPGESTTSSKPTTSSSKTTKSGKKSKSTKTVRKCKTRKNGKVTCTTVTKVAKAAQPVAVGTCAVVAQPAAWPGGYLITVDSRTASSSRLVLPASAGVTSVLDAGSRTIVQGTGDPAAVGVACSGG